MHPCARWRQRQEARAPAGRGCRPHAGRRRRREVQQLGGPACLESQAWRPGTPAQRLLQYHRGWDSAACACPQPNSVAQSVRRRAGGTARRRPAAALAPAAQLQACRDMQLHPTTHCSTMGSWHAVHGLGALRAAAVRAGPPAWWVVPLAGCTMGGLPCCVAGVLGSCMSTTGNRVGAVHLDAQDATRRAVQPCNPGRAGGRGGAGARRSPAAAACRPPLEVW